MIEDTSGQTMRYPANLTPDDNDTILVTFPDVPGAVSFGKTREEALAHGLEALLTVLNALMADRRDVPAPSPVVASQPFVTILPIDVAKIALYRATHDGGKEK